MPASLFKLFSQHLSQLWNHAYCCMQHTYIIRYVNVYILSDAIRRDVCGIRRHAAQLRLVTMGIAQPTVVSE
jgi:hypothetical protein